MLIVVQSLVFIAALAGIVTCSLAFLFFAGRALSKARPQPLRLRSGVFAALCLTGVVASAAAGFVGIAALMYFAMQ